MISLSAAFAGDLKYPVDAIPEELKKGVDYVFREDIASFKITSRSGATYHVRQVITIFNDRGNDQASQVISYDKETKIVIFSGYVYDATGKQIKKLKSSEIYDQAAFDGFSLYSDNRLKAANLSQAIYPYTIEFDYEIEYKFLYAIPSFYVGGGKSSTQHASFQLIFPHDLAPRYKVVGVESDPKKEKLQDGSESITWNFENVKPINFEPYGPDKEEQTPHIMAAPSKFEYDGYVGDMSTWKDYGKWNLLLNKNRDELPEPVKQKVRELTQGLLSVEQKARAIYEYLQSKTRYVSIQLGIGGLQPFPASVVDQMGYGDCKALSNYTVALLKEAGVQGYYTIIQAGKNENTIESDFPSHQFNHVVVSVPNGKDTLWLECTSQTNPFGYQGTFTEDRKALVISSDGGKLVKTINYTPEQNLQSRTALISLDDKGNATAKIKTTNTGIQYENNGLNWVFNNSEKQKKWIEENTTIPNFSVNSYVIKENKDKVPSATISLDLVLNRYASISGKRLFMVPNIMNRFNVVPEKIAERKTEVVRKSNFVDLDTIVYSIPENLYLEFQPQPVKINSKFGEYETNFKFEAGKVIYTRRLKMWKGRFPKEAYNELVDFYKSVSKSDNTKLVFLNKT
jgi:hypothetical protein